MAAHKYYDTRNLCLYCGHEWAEGWREKILVEGRATEAAIEYQKCSGCGQADYRTIFVVVESQHHPNEGPGYSLSIPADSQAWDTPTGERVWDKLLAEWLTSKQVEGLYGLKPGTVRKAVNRGYIRAKKEGHDLFILASQAEQYWGNREQEEIE